MKGLLLKEWYTYTRDFKLFFAIWLFILVWVGYVGGTNAIILGYPALIGAIIPSSAHSSDERSGWALYADLLPVTRKNVVCAKYISGLALCAVEIVLVFASTALFSALSMGSASLSAETALIIVATFIMVGLLPIAIAMPFFYKFGVERGRLFYLIFGAAMGVTAVLAPTGINSAFWEVGRYVDLRGAAAIICLLVLALYLVSYFISARVYEKREL